MSKILLAYASRHGATAEIAEHIAQVLRDVDLHVDLYDLKAKDDGPNLTEYDAVVLGSAIYAGQWMGAAAKFLRENVIELTKRPTWLFSSGPIGEGDASEILDGFVFPEALQPLADEIQAQSVVLFHGKLDMDDLSFGERVMVRMVKAPTGDSRNWQIITTWAQDIANTLVEQRERTTGIPIDGER